MANRVHIVCVIGTKIDKQGQMKFQFKIQGCQTEAVKNTVNVFRGQPKRVPKHYRRDVGRRRKTHRVHFMYV